MLVAAVGTFWAVGNLSRIRGNPNLPFYAFSLCSLLYEFGLASLEFLLAGNAAKMVGFALIGDLVFGCVFV